MILKNGKDTPLNQNSGTLPDVSTALKNWMQPMTFGLVTKVVENFQVKETMLNISFQGVWQPFSPKQLLLKPEGQRSWSWFWLHAETGLNLEPDQVVTYVNKQYRVMAKNDYNLYGYVEYHLIEDFTDSGPQVIT